MDNPESIYDMTIAESMAQYHEGRRDDGLRPASLGNGYVALGGWDRRWAAKGITMMSQITFAVIKDNWREYRDTVNPRTGRCPGDLSRRDVVVHCKTWLRWAYDHHQIAADKFYGWQIPRADDPYVLVWTDAQLDDGLTCIDRYYDLRFHPEILSVPAKDREKLRLRARGLVCTGMSAGLRQGEIIGLSRCDYVPSRKVLIIRTSKGRTHREVPIGDKLCKILNAMLEKRSAKCPTDYLFVTEDGTQMTGAACLRQIQRIMAWGRRTQGLDLPRFTMHSLRHKALSSALNINPEHARLMGGHKDVSTTQRRYGHTVAEDARETADKADVLNRIIIDTRADKKPRSRRMH